ncbi:MAG: hypothetical protein HGA67_03800 [Candidatus Yonathbacteria bacterium]|nr:hypothetical protein [Candidatus Yonathbacteria bacterium]
MTILTQYGYNSYFNIPASFIDVSIRENIVYLFELFHVALAILGLFAWWVWMGVIVLSVAVFFGISSHRWGSKTLLVLVRVIFSLFLLFMLYQSYGFGTYIAENSTEFYVPVSDCVFVEENFSYIIPTFYQDRIIFVMIDKNRKMTGNILLGGSKDLGCMIEKKHVGLVTK